VHDMDRSRDLPKSIEMISQTNKRMVCLQVSWTEKVRELSDPDSSGKTTDITTA
jgi:hypothetical protein